MSTIKARYKMKTGKKLVVLWTRINGVERVQVSKDWIPDQDRNDGKRGLEINREFHEALGLKVGGVR